MTSPITFERPLGTHILRFRTHPDLIDMALSIWLSLGPTYTYLLHPEPQQEFLVFWGPLSWRRNGNVIEVFEHSISLREWHTDLTTSLANIRGQQLLTQTRGVKPEQSTYQDMVSVHESIHNAHLTPELLEQPLYFERFKPNEHHSGWMVTPTEVLRSSPDPGAGAYSLLTAFQLVYMLHPAVVQFLSLPTGTSVVYEKQQQRLVFVNDEPVTRVPLYFPEDAELI